MTVSKQPGIRKPESTCRRIYITLIGKDTKHLGDKHVMRAETHNLLDPALY